MFVVGESSMSPNLDINDAVLVKDSSITDIKEEILFSIGQRMARML